jgi:hypothetical protein
VNPDSTLATTVFAAPVDYQTPDGLAAGEQQPQRPGRHATALGLLGALLGTAVAYLATIALFRSQLGERVSQVPVLDLTLVVIGLPVAATIGSWLLAGHEPPAIAYQPIE